MSELAIFEFIFKPKDRSNLAHVRAFEKFAMDVKDFEMRFNLQLPLKRDPKWVLQLFYGSNIDNQKTDLLEKLDIANLSTSVYKSLFLKVKGKGEKIPYLFFREIIKDLYSDESGALIDIQLFAISKEQNLYINTSYEDWSTCYFFEDTLWSFQTDQVRNTRGLLSLINDSLQFRGLPLASSLTAAKYLIDIYGENTITIHRFTPDLKGVERNG